MWLVQEVLPSTHKELRALFGERYYLACCPCAKRILPNRGMAGTNLAGRSQLPHSPART